MSDDERSSGSSAADPQAEGNSDLETLQRELEETKAKVSSYLDLAQRTQADFLNYKRRVEQERGEYSRSARADIIVRFLPVLDDLELALASQPAELAGSVWAQGVGHIGRKIGGILDNLGVKAIDVVGKPYDPWQSEAVGQEASITLPVEYVTRVARGGYTLDGKVIRAAQVLISSGPPE